MQMGPYSPTRPTRMHPDQILSGLMPLVETYWRQVTAGAHPGSVLQEALLTGYLSGSGMSPAGASDLVRQWRQSGVSQLLAQDAATPPLPTAGAPEPTAAKVPPVPTAAPAVPGMPQEMLAPLLQEIQGFMQNQATAANCYAHLLQEAAQMGLGERLLGYIRHAMEDEQGHYRMLADLHERLSGETYAVNAQPVTYPDLRTGLLLAMDDQYKAFEEYREIYLGQIDPEIRNLFFLLMTDELEHATKFAYVLQELPVVE